MITGRRRSDSLISVSEHALRLASRHARERFPDEMGGILVGWREGSTVIVHDLLVVEAKTAATHHYDRQHDLAQQMLERITAADKTGQLGYVGEWHTHPAPHPPSATDLKAITSIARTLDAPIALLVLAAHRDGKSIEPLGVTVQRNRRGHLKIHAAHIGTH